MDFLTNLGMGFSIAISPANLVYCAIGAILGTSIGVLPGLGPAATIALLLPVTYTLEPTSAIIMLAGIFFGATYGGSITSILLNIPGESSSVVTCLDGYQMARQGKAGTALGVCALGSFFAGTVATLGLSLLAPLLASLAIKFGPPEYVALLILGLLMVVYLSGDAILKGLIMLAMGMLLSTVGLDPVQGDERFTFGLVRLGDGLQFVVVAMGLFGLAEVLLNLETPEVRDTFKTALNKLFPSREDWKVAGPAVVRGSLLGFLIGVLPGGGAVISTFASYGVEKKISRHPKQFGKGAIEGVAAPESANNAAATSSFVPLLTLGVPGNSATAMIFIALLLHDVRPGPLLLTEHPELFWGVIASMYIGNVMLLGLNLPLISVWVRLLKVPYKYLALVIVTMCVIGAYSVANSIFDVGMMVCFGVLGYLLKKADFPAAPLILALILCPRLERSIQQSLIGSAGDPWVFVASPISLVLNLLTLLLIVTPLIRKLWRLRSAPQPARQ